MKKIISLITILCLLATQSTFVFAENEKEKIDLSEITAQDGVAYQQAKLKNVKSAIKMNQNYIAELNLKANGVSEEIEKIDNYILEIQEELDIINAEISKNDLKIEEINAKKIQRQNELLSLKEEYLKQKESLIKLNNSKNYSISQLKSKTNSLKLITANLDTTLQQVSNEDLLETSENSLNQMSNAKIKEQKEQVELKQQLLEQQQTEKNNLLISYFQKIQNSENNINHLEDTTETITEVINRLQSLGYEGKVNLIKGNGVLSYPCKTIKVTSDYGMRIHPISGQYKMHTGIDFGGQPTGTPVYASAPGIVITAGWLNGYGYTVIIDHGNKISTLYAHNSKLLVSVGDEVERGQAIAKVGSTGNSTGPHIHFEVRVNGKYTDPKEWL